MNNNKHELQNDCKFPQDGYWQYLYSSLLKIGKIASLVILSSIFYMVYSDFAIIQKPQFTLTRIIPITLFLAFLIFSITNIKNKRPYLIIVLYYIALFSLLCMAYAITVLSINTDLFYLTPTLMLLVSIAVFLAMIGPTYILASIYGIPTLVFLGYIIWKFPYLIGDMLSMNIIAVVGLTVMYYISEKLRKRMYFSEHKLKSKNLELKNSEESKKILLDNIKIQVWYLTDETTYGAVNKAHAEFNGMKVEDLAYKNIYDIYPKDLADFCKKTNLEVFLNKKTVYIEEWIPHFPGKNKLMAITKIPKLRPDGTVEYVVCSAEDITEQKQTEQTLQQNFDFQKIIANISLNFVKTTQKSFDADINNMLMKIGNFFQVDRSYLFLFSDNQETMTNTHEWCNKGVTPQMKNIQNQPIDSLPWWKSAIYSNNPVHIQDINVLPDEAKAEKTEFRSQNIKSLISIPIKSPDKIWGFIGFDSVKKYYSWTDNEINNLQIIANITVDLLLKLYNEEKLIESKKQLDMFFSQSYSGFNFMMLDEPIYWNDDTDKEAMLDYIMNHQRMTKVNQAMLDQYGANEKDFIGLTPNELFAHNP